MTSTTVKGAKYENMAIAILEGRGYDCHKAQNKVQWIPDGKGGRRPISRSHDIFGCIDIVAKDLSHTRYVQVTVPDRYADHAEKILSQDWPPCDVVEVWLWYAGRRKLDKRYKDRKVWILAQCFKVYRLDHDKQEFVEHTIIGKDGEPFEVEVV